MSTVSSTSSVDYSLVSSSSSSSSSSGTSLSFDSFVTLLATELQYQDPSDPVSATEYVSQMAQISSLSAISSIYTAVNNTSAYSMIGKTVSYSATDTSGNTVTGTGTVSSVIISGSNTYLNVGGTAVNVEDVTEVASTTSSTST